ncbi:MAG: YjjG family noncanonical pyrimidine nucleotidase [Butyrivibrio sp.]|nr:YjjG family noncanonical pyrimidine nucleotidase [Butyrivibrio sp.]
MYRNILFDLDNTLLDFNKAEEDALSLVLLGLGVEPARELIGLYSRINLSQWKRLELGELTLEETKVNRFRLFFEELGLDASPQRATAEFEELLHGGFYTVCGARELLRDLYGSFRMYIASNGTASVQRSRIKGADIADFFDGVFISQELGAKKPDAEFFEKCFRAIPDFAGEETLIVGDSLTSDIRGGINSGIDTVWYNPMGRDKEENVMPVYEISRLEDLKAVLNK